jgi:polysaccharide biosynthesis transport protein
VKQQPSSSHLPTDLLADLSPKEYWEILRRRAMVMVLVATAVVGAAVVVIKHMPNVYRAETVIMVDPQKVPDSYVPSTVSTSISDRLSTLQQQIMSPTRLKHTIDTLGLYPELRGAKSEQDLIAKMQAATSLDVSGAGSAHMSTFKIGFQGDNPTQVAEVANQLAKLFIAENSAAREEQFSGTAEFLTKQLHDTKAQLEQKETELQRIKSQYVLDLPESKQFHMESLTNLRTRLQSIQDQINRAQQDKALLQAVANGATSGNDAAATTTPVTSVSPYAAQIQQLETQLSNLQTRYSPNHPDIRRVQEQLTALRAKAAEEPGVASSTDKNASTPDGGRKAAQLNSELQRLDREIQNQKQAEAQVQEEIRTHTAKLEGIPVFEEKMASLMRDHDTLQRFYNSLLDKKLSAEMASELENREVGERFIILDPASPPAKPYAPKRRLLALVSLFAGLALGVVVAVIIELLDQSVRSEREAADIVGVPVLAGVPEFMTPRQKKVVILKGLIAWVATAAGSLVLGEIVSQISARWF